MDVVGWALMNAAKSPQMTIHKGNYPKTNKHFRLVISNKSPRWFGLWGYKQFQGCFGDIHSITGSATFLGVYMRWLERQQQHVQISNSNNLSCVFISRHFFHGSIFFWVQIRLCHSVTSLHRGEIACLYATLCCTPSCHLRVLSCLQSPFDWNVPVTGAAVTVRQCRNIFTYLIPSSNQT